MLGLPGGLMWESNIGSASASSIGSPAETSSLIGWWDFTDANTMYTDDGSTNVSSNNDKIYRIDNKAYAIQDSLGTPTLALGRYLEQSVEARRPIYKTSSATPISDFPFTQGDFSHGFFDVVPDGENNFGFPCNLEGSKTIGNVASGVFSSTAHSMSSVTLFFVYRTMNYAGYPQYMFYMQGHDQSCTSFMCPFSTKQTISFRSNSGAAHDSDPDVHFFISSNDGPDENKYRSWYTFDHTAYTQSDFRHFQFWTVKVGETFANYNENNDDPPYVRPGKLYKNGDESDGVPVDAWSIYDDYGNNTAGGTDLDSNPTALNSVGRLNWGTSGTMEPDALWIGTWFFSSPFDGQPMALGTLQQNIANNTLLRTELYEIIYYSRELSNSEILGVENYLKTKYGTRVDYDSSWDF
tara:strand:- start:366 stop:1592 length:1227 start_codon:yes stop_codon:yes gene_type:complete